MEILVILMLSSMFLAITMFIVSFVMLRKHHTNKVYAKGDNQFYIDDDEDDEDNNEEIKQEFAIDEPKEENPEISNQEIIFNDEIKSQEFAIDEPKEENIEINNQEVVFNDEIKRQEFAVDEPREENIEINNQEPILNEEIEEKELIITEIPKDNESIVNNNEFIIDELNVQDQVINDIAEVINVLIDKKNYIFLANDNIVNKGDHIKLLLNKKIYYGVVTKANYKRDIKLMKISPRKLVIIKDKEKKPVEKQEALIEDLSFIPKKKQK